MAKWCSSCGIVCDLCVKTLFPRTSRRQSCRRKSRAISTLPYARETQNPMKNEFLPISAKWCSVCGLPCATCLRLLPPISGRWDPYRLNSRAGWSDGWAAESQTRSDSMAKWCSICGIRCLRYFYVRSEDCTHRELIQKPEERAAAGRELLQMENETQTPIPYEPILASPLGDVRCGVCGTPCVKCVQYKQSSYRTQQSSNASRPEKWAVEKSAIWRQLQFSTQPMIHTLTPRKSKCSRASCSKCLKRAHRLNSIELWDSSGKGWTVDNTGRNLLVPTGVPALKAVPVPAPVLAVSCEVCGTIYIKNMLRGKYENPAKQSPFMETALGHMAQRVGLVQVLYQADKCRKRSRRR